MAYGITKIDIAIADGTDGYAYNDCRLHAKVVDALVTALMAADSNWSIRTAGSYSGDTGDNWTSSAVTYSVRLKYSNSTRYIKIWVLGGSGSSSYYLNISHIGIDESTFIGDNARTYMMYSNYMDYMRFKGWLITGPEGSLLLPMYASYQAWSSLNSLITGDGPALLAVKAYNYLTGAVDGALKTLDFNSIQDITGSGSSMYIPDDDDYHARIPSPMYSIPGIDDSITYLRYKNSAWYSKFPVYGTNSNDFGEGDIIQDTNGQWFLMVNEYSTGNVYLPMATT